MLIRFFREGDTEALADLLCDMSRHYNGDNASSRAVVRQNLVDNILGSDSDVRIVVAVDETRVVGVAMISLMYPAPKERAQLFMKELYVAADARSCGIGHRLMGWIAQFAVDHNCIRFDWTVDADNAPALAFYRSLGATHVADKLYFRISGNELRRFAGTSRQP